MQKIYILLFLFFTVTIGKAQYHTLSEQAEISIISIGPGDQLYDKFGHSAFRVKDEGTQIDSAYNYGSYDFKTPNFYTKFARGQLLYRLVANYYEPFLESYIAQNRWVKEQTLNLSYSEKQALFNFLENNRKPENQFYKYDFFFDNCATKIRDVLVEVLGDRLEYKDDHIIDEYTFRELIQQNVDANTWGSLGMDVAIGAVVDKKATAWEYQFLPQYVFEGAENAILKRRGGITVPLVKKSESLYKDTPRTKKTSFFTSPLFVFGLIGVVIIFITFKDYRNKTRSRYLDAAIFFISGLIGVFLLLLWFGTDHSTTVNNYNLLWAFPLSLLFTFVIVKKQPKIWIRRYMIFLIIAFVLLCIHWLTGVQVFAIGLLPLFIALVIRYVYVVYFLKTNSPTVL